MSKKRNTNKLIQTKSAVVDTTPLMINSPVVEIPTTTAPVVDTTATTAPVSGLIMGVPNLTSRRITPGTRIDTYRVCNSQRKTDTAKYYVQGGSIRIDPESNREMFTVAVEIPHTDLYLAKQQKVQLNLALRAEREIAQAS